ncbi:MAG: inorganic diphosphatase [Candidatus Nomurabacteria bacterium]|jgi:inorganic pyrophosphatase|nr:inorganic diphosphatase [Candidatus Nomurabacteria bacterium]
MTKTSAIDFIGKAVDVVIDRPLGSRHPEHDTIYEVNYGFVPQTISGDGEELDAYILNLDKPAEKISGKVIAVIQRLDDDDDKLIISANGQDISDEDIRKMVNFQEKYFKYIIKRGE